MITGPPPKFHELRDNLIGVGYGQPEPSATRRAASALADTSN